jgi:uncharacterized DUF497 family protein
MRFEWDPAKAATNLRKHGVSFETAIRVFADPGVCFDQDRIVEGEPRWQAIGRIEGSLLLVVAHTIREQDAMEAIRIISARKANLQEWRSYEEANGSV